MRRWPVRTLSVLALALAAAIAAPAGAAAAHDPSALARRSDHWRAAMDSLHIPGLAVVIVTPDSVLRLGAWGWRDVERRLPVTGETRFYIASCTKPFTATAVAEAARLGKLDLDAPLVKTLPRFAVADSAATANTTLRHLLSHRPGIVSRAHSFGEAFTGEMTEDRFWRLLAGVRPAGRSTYSNLHFTLAGRALAAATGMPWGRALEALVLAPAGLSKTSADARDLSREDAALPYAWRDGRFEVTALRKSNRTMHAAGGMVTTPYDLARWLRLQLGDGALDGRQLLDAATLRSQRELAAPDSSEHPLSPHQRRLGLGLGWEVRAHRGEPLYAHNGRFEGAAAYMAFMPTRGVGVGAVANTSGYAMFLVEAIGVEAFELLLGHEPGDAVDRVLAMAARPRPAASGDTATARLSQAPARYAGSYANDTWGLLRIEARGRGLDGRIGDLPMPLRVTGPDRVLADGEYPGEFVFGPAGRARGLFLRMAPGDSAWFERR